MCWQRVGSPTILASPVVYLSTVGHGAFSHGGDAVLLLAIATVVGFPLARLISWGLSQKSKKMARPRR